MRQDIRVRPPPPHPSPASGRGSTPEFAAPSADHSRASGSVDRSRTLISRCQTALDNAPPAELRARAPRLSFFLLPNGERSAEKAPNLSRLRGATTAPCEARRAPGEVRTPLGAPPWRFQSPRPRFLNPAVFVRRTNAASSSQPGHSARRADPRGLPSLRLRAAAAGRHSLLRLRIVSR